MSDYAIWYNTIYKNRPMYNQPDKAKLDIVRELIGSKPVGKVLDVGCGRGHYLKQFVDMGFESLGIEPSIECSTRYLKGLPHAVVDFLSFEDDNKYDIVFCADVLEHIKSEEIDPFIQKLSEKGDYAIIGIANHPDIQEGIELHLIQEPWPWWENKLKNYYSKLSFLCSLHNNKFFFVQVWK